MSKVSRKTLSKMRSMEKPGCCEHHENLWFQWQEVDLHHDRMLMWHSTSEAVLNCIEASFGLLFKEFKEECKKCK